MNTSIGMEFSGFFPHSIPYRIQARHFVLNVMHIFVNVQITYIFFFTKFLGVDIFMPLSTYAVTTYSSYLICF